MKTDSGHELVIVDDMTHKKMTSNWEGCAKYGLRKLSPGDFYSTNQFALKINDLYHFKIRPSDIYVCSYLKVGSTWMKEIVWSILHNVNLDHPMQNEDAYAKAPWLETEVTLTTEQIPLALASKIPPGMSFFDVIGELPDPRVFQTHIPFSMLNPNTCDKSKVVYVIRDPRDVCLSYYHFSCNVTFYGYTKSLETFVDDFIDGHVFSGSYLDHLREWWHLRHHPNIYIVYYENMRKNGPTELKKLADFLEVSLTDKQVQNILTYSSFEEMKKREISGKNEEASKQFLKSSGKAGFFRKGEEGSFRSEMTPELNEKVAKHFRENLGEIELPYDLNVKLK